MEIPIESMLSGKKLELARMQDTVIGIIYNYVQPDAVLYGGTAVWRCYSGGRFSEDIDIYVNASFSKKIEKALSMNGIIIAWRNRSLPLHMRVSDGKTDLLLEASRGRHACAISQYTKVDGTSMTISALHPAELFVRKMEAYEGRRYVRDIYDLVHLTNYIQKDDYYVASRLKPFLSRIESQRPADEKILRSLIYKGPNNLTFKNMVDYLKRWANEV